eukprot:TRINITY_DN9071_c0_g2_i2.p1 TRINITY_DN9071_c0_g2~~TRINITY_DN9071_c0_g2_i2.p1  ORF type:complete len:296 (-),score=5.11 TRINITY_DN9071_c0_g2_i2:252-1109(-)
MSQLNPIHIRFHHWYVQSCCHTTKPTPKLKKIQLNSKAVDSYKNSLPRLSSTKLSGKTRSNLNLKLQRKNSPQLKQNNIENENTRREFILRSINVALVFTSVTGSNDATTIVNSVLSGYFLPTFGMSAGFKLYDDFDNDYLFEYPKAWVARSNTLREGIYVSNFQTADKATVDIFPIRNDQDLTEQVVQMIVSPTSEQQSDTLNMPSKQLIKSKIGTIEKQDYIYLTFPSETITRSGYQVRRKNFAVATIKRGKVYCFNASARSDQYNKEKAELLQHIVDSFRIR